MDEQKDYKDMSLDDLLSIASDEYDDRAPAANLEFERRNLISATNYSKRAEYLSYVLAIITIVQFIMAIASFSTQPSSPTTMIIITNTPVPTITPTIVVTPEVEN
ncbi:MAG: hypothetical protein AAF490_22885 [Chloroflexota bacterium]